MVNQPVSVPVSVSVPGWVNRLGFFLSGTETETGTETDQ